MYDSFAVRPIFKKDSREHFFTDSNKKESSILAWNVQNFTWVLFLPPTLPLIQSKQAQLQ